VKQTFLWRASDHFRRGVSLSAIAASKGLSQAGRVYFNELESGHTRAGWRGN
jgi:hypothetical protein